MEYENLAYDYTYGSEDEYTRQSRGKKNRRQMQNRNKYIQIIFAIAVVALSASYMISQFVSVKETQQQVTVLTKQLASEEAVTSQKLFDMEQSVDLSEIEEKATTKLGMQRPEKYQIIYVNVKNDDVTEKTANEVEGITKRISGAFKRFASHIVEFFSIE